MSFDLGMQSTCPTYDGQHLTSNPCHLSCWLNLIYHLNNFPAQFERVTSNINHFSFQKTWLLNLKFENDKVTCFGNRTVMNCNQDLANTCQIHQNTPSTCHHNFQPDECIWESKLRCIAFRHFPTVTFIRPCLDPSFLYFFTALLPS